MAINIIEQLFSIECRKAKTKALSLWPTTKDMGIPVNQSKLKALNTWSRWEARENVREWVTIGFGLILLVIGWKSGA